MINQPTRPEDRQERVGFKADYAVHTAVVVNNYDTLFSGRLQVWVPSYGGDPLVTNSWVTVQYANPFYGISSYSATQRITGEITAGQQREAEAAGMGQYLDNAKKQEDVSTFGMWVQPPAIGTKVLIVFADGDISRGYWFAAIPEVAHGMIPAIGKGQSGQPEAEFDPASGEVLSATDIRTVARPPHPSAATYETQGVQDDPLRGPVSTSSFRESPSNVMGFSTPSGHSFAMDDGDEGGASKLIRLRTAGGNQITMHDDSGMIYLINAQGTGWIELSPSGQIDVYGQAGINLASEGDVNIHGSKNVSIHAGENLKLVGMKGTKIQGTEEMQIHGAKTMIEGVDSLHLHSCQEIMITSFKDIFIKAFNFLVVQGKCFRWNSGTAKEAEQVPPEQPQQVDGYDTTVARAPSHEPYKNHENGQNPANTNTGAQGTEQRQEYNQQAGRGGAVPPTGQDPALSLVPGSSNFDASKYKATFGEAAYAKAVGGGRGFAVEQPGARASAINTAEAQRVNAAGATTPAATATTPATSLTQSQVQGRGGSPTMGSYDSASMSRAQQNAALGRGGAAPLGADPALANMPAQALDQIQGAEAMSSMPAGPGGGSSGFATGENCERPADGGMAGSPYNSDPNANAPQTNYAANNPEGKAAAEAYLGRSMSDDEYNALVAATYAEAGTNQTEQAWVSGTILNRARASGQTVNQVLNQPGQFEAVTGPGGASNYIRGPNTSRAASINGSMVNNLSSVPKDNYYFDAANPAAYRYGNMPTDRGGVAPRQIGASRFYPGAKWP